MMSRLDDQQVSVGGVQNFAGSSCALVIGAHRQTICPFSFNMCEETILARLAA
jgi:hypothetical protein